MLFMTGLYIFIEIFVLSVVSVKYVMCVTCVCAR